MAIAKRGREARTEFELLAKDKRRSLLLVRPETGRTHQIRVHLAAIGVPILYDKVYGKLSSLDEEPMPTRPQDPEARVRQLLHAWQLRVPHPAAGFLTVTAPIPGDFEHAVRAIGAEALALHYAQRLPALREADAPPSKAEKTTKP